MLNAIRFCCCLLVHRPEANCPLKMKVQSHSITSGPRLSRENCYIEKPVFPRLYVQWMESTKNGDSTAHAHRTQTKQRFNHSKWPVGISDPCPKIRFSLFYRKSINDSEICWADVGKNNSIINTILHISLPETHTRTSTRQAQRHGRFQAIINWLPYRGFIQPLVQHFDPLQNFCEHPQAGKNCFGKVMFRTFFLHPFN